MTDILLLLISAILVNNLVLTQLLGLCPFMHGSSRLASVTGIAAVTTVVLTAASICTWLLYHYLLLPFDLLFLRTIAYMLVITVVVSTTTLLLHKTLPAPYRLPAGFMPLLTISSAALGVALINDNQAHTLVESACYGLGAALGLVLVVLLFSALRERLAVADVPEPFRGPGIAFITAGLMSLAFMGFAGLV